MVIDVSISYDRIRSNTANPQLNGTLSHPNTPDAPLNLLLTEGVAGAADPEEPSVSGDIVVVTLINFPTGMPWAIFHESATYGSAFSGPGYQCTYSWLSQTLVVVSEGDQKVVLRVLLCALKLLLSALRPLCARQLLLCARVDHTVRPLYTSDFGYSDRCRCAFCTPGAGTRNHGGLLILLLSFITAGMVVERKPCVQGEKE